MREAHIVIRINKAVQFKLLRSGLSVPRCHLVDLCLFWSHELLITLLSVEFYDDFLGAHGR